MRASALLAEPSIRLGLAVGFLAACGQGTRSRPDDAPRPSPVVAIGDGAPAPFDAGPSLFDAADANPNRITVSITPPRAPGSGAAKRCALGGDPLFDGCSAGHGGLAVDAAGLLYVSGGTRVQRYRRAEDDGECRYDPVGPPIEMPPPPTRAQRLDGPVYMRSGGPSWRLSRAGAAIYAVDYLAGTVRVDRGKPEPACGEQFGYRAIAAVGRRVLVGRNGIEELVLGRRCTARSSRVDDKASGDVYGVAGALYLVSAGTSEIVRYDGRRRIPVGTDHRACSVVALADCGDGVCALDTNCMQILQIPADGRDRLLDRDALFDQRPWLLVAATPGPDGSLLVLARHRDVTGNDEICEPALYELPAVVFER